MARTDGCRIVLADGRELIDGIASWWTACHGYNHPHIRAAVERQLARHAACDVRRHGARAGAATGAAAGRAAAGRSRARVLLRVGFGRGRSRHEDGGAVLAQSRRSRAHQVCRLHRRLSWRHHWRRWRCAIRPRACTACSGVAARAHHRRPSAGRREHARRSSAAWSSMRTKLPASSSSRWCRARAACAFTIADVLRRLRAAADRHGLLLIFDEIFTGFGRTGSDVRLRSGRRRAGHHHACQSVDRRNLAARGDDCRKRACSTRSGRMIRRHALDAWADLYGQSAGLRRGQCLARSVRTRAAACSGCRDNGAAARGLGAMPGCCPASRDVRVTGRDRRGRTRPHRRSRRMRARFIRRRRVHPAVRQDRLSDAGLYHWHRRLDQIDARNRHRIACAKILGWKRPRLHPDVRPRGEKFRSSVFQSLYFFAGNMLKGWQLFSACSALLTSAGP